MDQDAKVPEKTGLDTVSNDNHAVTAVSQVRAESNYDRIEEAPGDAVSAHDEARLEKMCSAEKSADVAYSVHSKSMKRMIVLIAVVAGYSSQLTTSIYYPALTTIAQDLHVSVGQVNLTITTYMIFQALAPVLMGSVSDSYGRRSALIGCFIIYTGANIVLSVQSSYAGLLVVRAIQSLGCSATPVISSAVVTDLITSAERGSYIALTALPTVLGPSLGPVIGGVLTQYLGWKSIFWCLTIFSACMLLPILAFMPETRRVMVGDGSTLPPWQGRSFVQCLNQRHPARGKASSSQSLVMERIVPRRLQLSIFLEAGRIVFTKAGFLITVYGAIVYGGFYIFISTVTVQFQYTYGLSQLQQGLVFLPIGAGAIVAAVITGKMVDRNYRHHAERAGFSADKSKQIDLTNFPIERARLEIAIPMFLLVNIGTIAYGWVLQKNAHIGWPCALLFVLGFALNAAFSPLAILLCDLYRDKPATANAAGFLVKCPLGAGAVAIANPMIQAVGIGWTFTIVGLVQTALLPMLYVLLLFGRKWRNKL